MRIRIVFKKKINSKNLEVLVIRVPSNKILDRIGLYVIENNKLVINMDRMHFWCLNGAVLSKKMCKILGIF